jgi:hypothetical protein
MDKALNQEHPAGQRIVMSEGNGRPAWHVIPSMLGRSALLLWFRGQIFR